MKRWYTPVALLARSSWRAVRATGNLATENKTVRRAVLVWAVLMNSWVVYRVFGAAPPDIPSGTATALAAVITIFTAVIGFNTIKEDKRDPTDDR